jgi:hypothetical protein
MPLYYLISILIGGAVVFALAFALGMYFAPRPFVVASTARPAENPDLDWPQFGKPTKELYNAADYETPLRCSGTDICNGHFSQNQPFWLIPLHKHGKEIGVVAYCLDCIPQSNGVFHEQ